jgi:hypothetical protein
MKSKLCFLMITAIFFGNVSSAAGYQFLFTPRISASEEYSDNIFLSADNEEYDYITSITPGFTAELLGKISGVRVSYDPSYVFYKRFSENDGFRHNALVSAWTAITKHTTLEFNDAFIRTEDPLSEEDFLYGATEASSRYAPGASGIKRSEEDEGITYESAEGLIGPDSTVRKGREPYWINTADLRLNHQFGALDSIYAGYVYSILENQDPEVENSERYTPSIGLIYWFLPHLGFETNASYTRGDFEASDDFDRWNGSLRLIKQFTKNLEGYVQYGHTVMEFEGDTENYQVYDPSVGVSWVIAEDTLISLSAGYYFQDRERSEDESGATLNGNIGKTWRLKRGSINIGASSGYEESYFGAENLGFNQYYQGHGSVSYSLTQSLVGSIFGSHRRNEYINQEDDRIDKITGAGLGITFQPITARWLSTGLNYSYHTVDSTRDENNYDENRVLLTVTLSKTIPIRFGR